MTGELDRIKNNLSQLVKNQSNNVPIQCNDPLDEAPQVPEPSERRPAKRMRKSYSEIIRGMNRSGTVSEYNSKLRSLKKITGVKFCK
ncbi:hypothetical protein AYI70_g3601, partial [Smittium culicis]